MPAAFCAYTRRFEIQQITVGLPADGIEQPLAVNILAAGELGEHPVALFVEADRNHFFAEPKYRAQLPQLEAQALHNFAVHEIQQDGTLIKQRDFHAQCGEHGCVFQSDNAGAHDDQVAGDFFQAMHLVGVENSFAINRNFGAVGWPRAAGDENVLTVKQLGTLVVFDFEGMGVQEARVAFKNGDVVPAQLRLDHFHFTRHDRFRPEDEVGHGDPVFQRIATAIKRALPETAEVQNRFPQGLAWDGSGMHADPTHALCPINDGHFLAHLGGADGAFLARRTAADHYQVVFVGFHKREKVPFRLLKRKPNAAS